MWVVNVIFNLCELLMLFVSYVSCYYYFKVMWVFLNLCELLMLFLSYVSY